MAPEQLQDGASVSPQSDIYALGAILYECLAGHSPHSGGATHELMFKIMNDEPMPLDQLRTEVPAELARILARCLSKTPQRRHANARALATALAPFARPGGVSLTIQTDTVDFEGRAAFFRPSRPRSALLYLGVGLVAGATLSAVSQLGRAASKGAASTPALARSERGAVSSSTPVLASSGSGAMASSALHATSSTSLALPAKPIPPAIGVARNTKPSVSSAVAVPRAAVTSVVIAPTSRFDSVNPYSR
jgi:serine/threonine protein kinase